MSMGSRILALGAVVGLSGGTAHAVLIYTPGSVGPPTPATETRNSAPGNSSAGTYLGATIGDWVGQYAQYSGTAIGAHSFVFAKHTYSNLITTFTLGGVTHNITAVTFDPSGSDLVVGTVDGPAMSFAPLYTTSDEFNKDLAVFGRGRLPGDPVTSGTTLNGYDIANAPAADGTLSYGIDTVDFAAGDSLMWDFEPVAGSTTLTDADSGGGVFVLKAGVWRLAGVNYGISSPFSHNVNGSNPFDATIFEATGLYYNFGTSAVPNWKPASGPGVSDATRISAHTSFLSAFVPEPSALSVLAVGGMLARRRRRN